MSGKQFKRHHRQGILIGSSVLYLAAPLFRSHVRISAAGFHLHLADTHDARADFRREAKVHDLNIASIRIQHDVLRFDVAMNDLPPVSVVERLGDRRQDSNHFRKRKLAVLSHERLPVRGQCVAFQILHHEEVSKSRILSQQIDRANVFVLQVVDAVEGLFDTCHFIRAALQFWRQHLDDDRPFPRGVVSLPDLAHATTSQSAFQLESPQFHSRFKQRDRRRKSRSLAGSAGLRHRERGR